MSKRLPALASLVLAAALCAAAPLSAEILTKKFDWAPVGGVEKVDMQLNDIAISQLKFDLGDTIAPVRRSTAKVDVRVDNNSDIDQEVGIAVALFDENNNMVAAGNGGNKFGELNKGDREVFTVHFSYVYRYMKTARSILITLETKPKGSAKWKAKPTPTATP